VYASDFGRLSVIPSRWSPAQTVLLLDPEFLSMASYRNFKQEPIAKVGDAERRTILVEYALVCKTPTANAKITGAQ